MIEIKPVSVSETFEQARELARKHWQETESDFSRAEPDLDLEVYRHAENAGMCLSFGAFSDGELVGYIAGFIVRHQHYDMIVGQHDLLFVDANHRKGRLGLKLMAEFEKAAADKGARCVLYHAKIDSQFSSILNKTGCKPEEIIYRKDF